MRLFSCRCFFVFFGSFFVVIVVFGGGYIPESFKSVGVWKVGVIEAPGTFRFRLIREA